MSRKLALNALLSDNSSDTRQSIFVHPYNFEKPKDEMGGGFQSTYDIY